LYCVSNQSNKQKKRDFFFLFNFRQMVVLHSLESDESGLAARKTAGFKALPSKDEWEGYGRSEH
jgi:hypothetical protein